MIDYTIKSVGLVNDMFDDCDENCHIIDWQLLRFDGKTPLADVQKALTPYLGVPVRVKMHYASGGYLGGEGVLLVDEDGSFGLSEFVRPPLDMTKIEHKNVDIEIATLEIRDDKGRVIPCSLPCGYSAASITTDELLEGQFRDRHARKISYATNTFD